MPVYLKIKRPQHQYPAIHEFPNIIEAQHFAISDEYEFFTISNRNGDVLYEEKLGSDILRACDAITHIDESTLSEFDKFLNENLSNPFFDFTAMEGEA